MVVSLATDEFTTRTTSTSYLAAFSPPIDVLALLLVLPYPKYGARPCPTVEWTRGLHLRACVRAVALGVLAPEDSLYRPDASLDPNKVEKSSTYKKPSRPTEMLFVMEKSESARMVFSSFVEEKCNRMPYTVKADLLNIIHLNRRSSHHWPAVLINLGTCCRLKYLVRKMFQSDVHFYIGLSLALASTIFIGCSFIVKKIALRRLAATGTRAGDGGYQYLCDWVWWLGLILMGLGEAANFAGYTFAPASLVTPMGGLSVLVSAVFSSHFLGERLNFIGKIGCVVCICGSTMVVLHAPKEQEVQSLHELSIKVMDPGFLTYAIAVAVAGIVSIFVIAPKFGTRNPLVFVFISGSIGSLSVMACKGIGLGFKEAIEYGILAILRQWIFWFFLIGLVFCLTVQLNYLNRALDIFNTSIVTPLLYVFFTAFVLIASTILFKEGSSLSPTDYIGNAVGLICIVSGIVLLTLFRDMNVSLGDLVKDFMGPVPTRVVHLSSDLSFKHRFSPTWCKRKGRGLSDETYTLLSTSNECSGSNESSHNSSPNHDMIEYPKLEHHHQGVHQRTGSGASAFNFASVAATTENYSTVSEAANINHSTIWTSIKVTLSSKCKNYVFPFPSSLLTLLAAIFISLCRPTHFCKYALVIFCIISFLRNAFPQSLHW
ncbi:Magnesium transporter NIPA2 [Echinococcus granulosus]|uniref:Magnesium transporter NIPA2 n=1 Tax=Echinococcus granulosus TaxID=6210 RepID=A0A068W8S4_ECHGR|nr:Magnesium transporter NIPA2 [Echinococcus granulosus]CDS16013.1 protein of unknown function DUF803 [Echinococcus granulosus]